MKNMNFPRAGELHKKRAGRQAAPQDGQVGCTLRQSGGLNIKLGCGKGWAGGLPFSAVRPALFRNPTDRLICASRRPAPLSCVQQPASPPKIHLFHLETRPSSPPGPPALQLVLSLNGAWMKAKKKTKQKSARRESNHKPLA